LFVFLISPASLAEGRYTLTELKFARAQWPKPMGRIVPVMIRDTPVATIPAYLSSLNIIKPEGNVVAEVVSAIQDQRKSQRFGRVAVYAALGVAVLALVAGGVFGIGWLSQQAALRAQADACAIANELMELKSPDQLSEAAMRQGAMCRELVALKQGDPRERQVTDLMGQGEVDQAMGLLEDMAKEKPETSERWERLATLAYWRDIDRALRAREAIARLEPADIGNRFDLADLYSLKGRGEEALAQYQAILDAPDDKFARLLALQILCAQGPAVVAAHPDWTCTEGDPSLLLETYKTTSLDPGVASGLALRTLFGMIATSMEQLRTVTSLDEINAANAKLVTILDAATAFSEEALKSAQNQGGLAELIRIRLDEFRVLGSILSGVQAMAGTMDAERMKSALHGGLARFEELADRTDQLASRFSSPVVQLQRGSIAINAAQFGMLELKVEAQGSAIDPAKLDPVLAEIEEFSDQYLLVHERHPGWGIANQALFFIYQLEDQAERNAIPRARQELAKLDLAWAKRLGEVEGNSIVSRMAMVEATFYGWRQYEGAEKEEVERSLRSLIAELKPLKEAEQWAERLAFIEQRLER
jgi:hypothetical protein